MKTILVTGSNGFIGKNTCLFLKSKGYQVFGYDVDTPKDELYDMVSNSDFIIHLAGINRPLTKEEFYDGNVNFTIELLNTIKLTNKKIPLFFASSTQAEIPNDYGTSKRMAEDEIFLFSRKYNNNPVFVYRFPNVFGKWCKPNYNSAVATFCYNIANNLPIQVNDRNKEMTFLYIDDIMNEFVELIEGKDEGYYQIHSVSPSYNRTLGEMADIITSFASIKDNLEVPNLEDPFVRKLYASYLSYLPEKNLGYYPTIHGDDRGLFCELIRLKEFGQISINVGKPGIVKGNHYHHTKSEKFITVSGTCEIKLRKIGEKDIISKIVSSSHIEVVDI